MKILTHDKLSKANGHYSTAVESNGMLYLSGQLPVSPDGTHHHQESFEEQCRIVFHSINQILETVGCSKDCIVKMTVFLSDVDLWPEFNTLYAQFMGDHKPARTVVPVSKLHYGYSIEVDLIAELNHER